ncbi:MAG: helix-turn-helix domain-containing protein [Desulfocucumaceae bacterium]
MDSIKGKLLRVGQLATRLNVSKRVAYRLIDEGQFSVLRVGGGLRIVGDSVLDYLQRQISVYISKN